MFETISLIEISDSHTQDESTNSETSEASRNYTEIGNDSCYGLNSCYGLELCEKEC